MASASAYSPQNDFVLLNPLHPDRPFSRPFSRDLSVCEMVHVHYRHEHLKILFYQILGSFGRWPAGTIESGIKYLVLGAHRLVRGGMELFQSDSLKWYMIYNAHIPATFRAWDVVRVLSEHPWIYPIVKSGFPIITLFEFLAPLAIVFRRFRIAFLFMMLSFFVLNWLFMSPIFWQNFLLCLLLFDFSGRISSGTRWFPFSLQKPIFQFRDRH